MPFMQIMLFDESGVLICWG